ncbi:MAG: hypothetical protein WCY11_04435 [Novosphingobium sp.]
MVMPAKCLQVEGIKAKLGEVAHLLDMIDRIAGLTTHDTIGLALEVLGPELAPCGVIPACGSTGAGGVGLGLALLLAGAKLAVLDAEATSADAGGFHQCHVITSQ